MLPPFYFLWPFFTQFLFDVLFCLGRYRIRTLVSFFSSGSFFGLPVFRGSVLRNLQGCFDILSSFFRVYFVPFLAICRAILISFFFFCFSGLFKGLSLLSDSVDFSFSKCSFFLIFSAGAFSWVFFYRAFLLSGSVLSSTPYVGLLCLLRMHAINSCVGDA